MFRRLRQSTFMPNLQSEDSSSKSENARDRGYSGGVSGSFFGGAIDTDKSNSTHHSNRSNQFTLICHYRLEKFWNYSKSCFCYYSCVKMRRCVSHGMPQDYPTRRSSAIFFIPAAFWIALSFTFLHQLDAYLREYQGPLDHVASLILRPYYGMHCPNFLSQQQLEDKDSSGNTRTNNRSSTKTAWSCSSIVQAKGDQNSDVMMPRMFMIGARDKNEDTYDDWMAAIQDESINSDPQRGPYFERINTLDISNRYALSGGALWNSTLIADDNRHLKLSTANDVSSTNMKPNRSGFLCRKMKWEHRLFAVYQTIFSHLLSTYPTDLGFVIIEDDAVLKDPRAFVNEICEAHNEQMEFYSLYQSPSQRRGERRFPSCIYVHGTVAFYIRRHFMEQIMNERRRAWFCRFPIDMYISLMGPWYASTMEIVDHLDSGRVGSIIG